MSIARTRTALLAMLAIAAFPIAASPQGATSMDVGKARVIDHWTAARRASAIPRDLVIDPRGLGYLRHPNGTLEPYGHSIAAQARALEPSPSPFVKPTGGSGDTTPPAIDEMNPASGTVIGASYTFTARVTDASGVKSVAFSVWKDGGTAQSFAASSIGDDTWSAQLQGFTDGPWYWQVVAKDAAKGRGNTAESVIVNFTVATGSSGGTGSVSSAAWTGGGIVQTAAGRLYFEMPANSRQTRWQGYVCSGTVTTDEKSGRSLVLTAAHCVYDDAHKAFARNVLFIPDQAGTTGAATDLDCSNDPLGCWVPSFGVVDRQWTLFTFPDNIAWDYAFYVVSDTGAHEAGLKTASDVLDSAAKPMTLSFSTPRYDDGTAGATSQDFTYALGYSYSEDPKLMYCADDMTTEGAVNWWLPGCGLTGGSSGGPWVQPMQDGDGPVISVNSWGYTNLPGMAGPKLSGTSAQCVFEYAKAMPFDGTAGFAADCAQSSSH